MNDAPMQETSRLTPEELYATALVQIEHSTANTPLPALRLFALNTMLKIEHGEVVIPQEDIAAVIRPLLVKFVSEVHGTVACLSVGQPLAAYHHVRALLELRAAAHHLRPTYKRHKLRAQRFVEYGEAGGYAVFASLEAMVANGKMTNEEFALSVDPPTIERRRAQQSLVADWEKLYDLGKRGRTIADLKAWHEPSSIQQLFEELAKGRDDQTVERFYAAACHAAHVSPLGHRLAQVSGRGWPLVVFDPKRLGEVAQLACLVASATVNELDELSPGMLAAINTDRQRMLSST